MICVHKSMLLSEAAHDKNNELINVPIRFRISSISSVNICIFFTVISAKESEMTFQMK